ncbi:transposable element tc3 transposase [Trichonephila clavipes]|nr:transposable element tc3 transposase [Trichonephila clavipes]
MMKKFEATRFLVSSQRSGRPSTAAAVVTTVEPTVLSVSAVAGHEKCSDQEYSRQTGWSNGSIWRELRISLSRHPYKLPHNQDFKPPDFNSTRDFANLLCKKLEEWHDWSRTVICIEEAHFTLSGAVNTHNFQVWTTENPHAFVEVPLQQPKETV